MEPLREYIAELEEKGYIDPDCKMCQNIFYPALLKGQTISEIFAPNHKPSERCRSGKNPHCTCDTCF